MKILPYATPYSYTSSNRSNIQQKTSFKKLVVTDEFNQDLEKSKFTPAQKEILFTAMNKLKGFFKKMDKDVVLAYTPAARGNIFRSGTPEKITLECEVKNCNDDYERIIVHVSDKLRENVGSDELASDIKDRIDYLEKFVYDSSLERKNKYYCDYDDDDDDFDDISGGISGTGWDLTDAYIP